MRLFIWLALPFSLIAAPSFKGSFSEPRYLRAGKIEIPTGPKSWDEFTSTATESVYRVGNSKTSDLTAWIGSGASTGVTRSQVIVFESLTPGQMYGVKIYGGYSTLSKLNLRAVVDGGNAQSEPTHAFPFAYDAHRSPWVFVFIAQKAEVRVLFEAANSPSSGYLYLDAWEFIQFPDQVPNNLFVWSGSSGPYLMGAPNNQSIKYSPLYKIRYQDLGYNPTPESSLYESRLKTLYFARRWLMNGKGVSESGVSQVENFAHSTLVSQQSVGVWIDNAMTTIRSKWAACGGRYLAVAGGIQTSKILVTLRPSFWWQGNSNLGPSWVHGMQSGHNLTAAVFTLSGLYSNPQNAYLVGGDRILEWEMGNLFRSYYGNGPIAHDSYGETGNLSPCGY